MMATRDLAAGYGALAVLLLVVLVVAIVLAIGLGTVAGAEPADEPVRDVPAMDGSSAGTNAVTLEDLEAQGIV